MMINDPESATDPEDDSEGRDYDWTYQSVLVRCWLHREEIDFMSKAKLWDDMIYLKNPTSTKVSDDVHLCWLRTGPHNDDD